MAHVDKADAEIEAALQDQLYMGTVQAEDAADARLGQGCRDQ